MCPVEVWRFKPLFVPVHKMFLSCGFFQKEVEVAVRSELPVRGVDVILGNDLVPDGCMRPVVVRPVLILLRVWAPLGDGVGGGPIVVLPEKL